MALDLFSNIYAFFSDVIPPATRARYCHNGGKIPTANQVIKGVHIDIFIGVQGRDDPLVQRIRALGFNVYDISWVTSSLKAKKLLDPNPFLITRDGSPHIHSLASAPKPLLNNPSIGSSTRFEARFPTSSSFDVPLTKNFEFVPSPLSQVTTLPSTSPSAPSSHNSFLTSECLHSEYADPGTRVTLPSQSQARRGLTETEEHGNEILGEGEFKSRGSSTEDYAYESIQAERRDEDSENEEDEQDQHDSGFFEANASQLFEGEQGSNGLYFGDCTPRSGSPDLPPWTEIEIEMDGIEEEEGQGGGVGGIDSRVGARRDVGETACIKGEEYEVSFQFDGSAGDFAGSDGDDVSADSTRTTSSLSSDPASRPMLTAHPIPEPFYASLLLDSPSFSSRLDEPPASQQTPPPRLSISSLFEKLHTSPLILHSLSGGGEIFDDGSGTQEEEGRVGWRLRLRSGLRILDNGKDGFEARRKPEIARE